MANVYVEARPKGRPGGTAIEDYVVEDHADHSAHINRAYEGGHHPLVARVRDLNDKKKPGHWRPA